jgi:hypothetical protein
MYLGTLGIIDINGDLPHTCYRFTSLTSNQVVYAMFDTKISIHMVRSVPYWDWYEDPGLSHHFGTCFAQAAKEFWTKNTYIVT